MSHHGMAVKNHNIPHVMHASCTSIPFATQKYYMRYIRTIPIPGLERARVARVLAEYPYRLYTDYMHGPGVDFISSSSPLSVRNRYASRLCIYYTSLWHPEYCYDEDICLYCICMLHPDQRGIWPTQLPRHALSIISIRKHVTDISDCSSSTCSF